MAAMAADKIEMILRDTEDGPDRRSAGRARGEVGARGARSTAFRAEHPLVRRLYLFDRHGDASSTRPTWRDATTPSSSTRLLAEVSQGFWEPRRAA